MKTYLFVFTLAILIYCSSTAQPISGSSESYILPDLLEKLDGHPVENAQSWFDERRPEILKLYQEQVFGVAPSQHLNAIYTKMSENKNALNGLATSKQIRISFNEDPNHYIDLLVYLPNNQKGEVPVFLGLNFAGNQTINPDTDILISKKWMPSWKDTGIVNNRSTEDSRGARERRWPVEKILKSGYGLATFYYGDVFYDRADGAPSSMQSLFSSSEHEPNRNSWGAIAAWAWGLSRAMDYLVTDTAVDSQKVIVMGHSRLGKASLWAGAQDQRFAMVVSNDSGEGGAAITRRKYGETIKDLNKNFPHWFSANFKQYDGREHQLPVDAHMLLALIAPRPLYVASASEDQWADPTGEYLAAYHTGPVYQLLGHRINLATQPPSAMQPVGLPGRVGYHMRAGKHDVLDYDWGQFILFADYHLKKRP